MTTKNTVSVCLTPELRLDKALKEAGIEDPASVGKLTISGTVFIVDFYYISDYMGETLEDLDMGDASLDEHGIPYEAFEGCTGLDTIVLPKTFIGIPWGLHSISSDLTSVTLSGMSLHFLLNEAADEADDDEWDLLDDDDEEEGEFDDDDDDDDEYFDEDDDEYFDDDDDDEYFDD